MGSAHTVSLTLALLLVLTLILTTFIPPFLSRYFLILDSYHAVGSHGHEAADVDWMVNYAGADYLKVDSCCGSQVFVLILGGIEWVHCLCLLRRKDCHTG